MSASLKSFLEHYRKHEVVLLESPMRLGRHFGEDLDHEGFNVETAKGVPKSSEKICQVSPLSTDLTLFREHYGDAKFQDYWLTGQPFLACYFLFQTEGEGLQSLGVWNHRKFKGTARDLLFSYYLEHFEFVVSDNQHTSQGESYWKKILDQAIQTGHKTSVVTRSGKEFDVDDADAYWGNGSDFSNYKLKVYAR